MVVSGLGIIISMLAGNMCATVDSGQAQAAKLAQELSRTLKDNYDNYLFDSKILDGSSEKRVEISLIRDSSGKIPPALIAEIEKIVYSKVKFEEGSLLINFYIKLKTTEKKEVIAFETSHTTSFEDIAATIKK